MIRLYHWEAHGACARVMFCLAEKGLDYESRYVDPLAFEQHKPELIALNPTGQLPILDDAGFVCVEATDICDYLEEAYPAVALMPEAVVDRWRVRVWQKHVDEYVAASIGQLAWQQARTTMFAGRDTAALEAAVAAIADKGRRDWWKLSLVPYPDDQLDRARERLVPILVAAEEALAHADWLVGSFSLADIALYAYLAFLPEVAADLLADRPAIAAWIGRVAARPAVRTASARGTAARPFAVAAPGQEEMRWG